VLVVDDAVVVRRMVSDALSSDLGIEVVGTAANGRIALAKIPELSPDLITLDVDMPEMDGLETLAEVRRRFPDIVVIMFSTLTERGAGATLDALALGARDYVTKPSNVGKVEVAKARIRDELIPKIKVLGYSSTRSSGAVRRISFPAMDTPLAPAPDFVPRPARPIGPPGPVQVVVIGVSTGGPNALDVVLPAFPADFPVPVVIVQHMPPLFTRLLADRLSAKSLVEVVEASAGARLVQGTVWIAPGGRHTIVRRHGTDVVLDTNEDPPVNSCRPSVDLLFESAARVYGAGTLAVVLTGMGQDGSQGCHRVRDAGGQILAQDQESSVVWGMPGYVARAGLADKVLPLEAIAGEISDRVGRRSIPFASRAR
jgi:two-component system chemotaxis response regulator CheB